MDQPRGGKRGERSVDSCDVSRRMRVVDRVEDVCDRVVTGTAREGCRDRKALWRNAQTGVAQSIDKGFRIHNPKYLTGYCLRGSRAAGIAPEERLAG